MSTLPTSGKHYQLVFIWLRNTRLIIWLPIVFIRPPLKEEELEKINVDLKEFMEGPGRFVTPGDFSFIKYSLIQIMMKLLIAILIHIIIFQEK